jgi:hypothetical protein
MTGYPARTLTGAANTEARPEPETALPQLNANVVGDNFPIPKVSPGKTLALPNWREIRTAPESQLPIPPPALLENVRR